MKTKILPTVFMIGMIINAVAQNPVINLTFTAENNGQYVPLDSIHIENLTQGEDTSLYAPDTVLTMDYITNIGDGLSLNKNNFFVSQNYPNPFSGKTNVDVFISGDQNINISVMDLPGREISQMTLKLKKGAHTFTIYPGNGSIYLLSVNSERESQTIKMFNAGPGSLQSSQCKIVYNPGYKTEYGLKAAKTVNSFSFSLGDLLRFTGYGIMLNSNPGSDTLEDAPLTNTLYTFNIHEDSIAVLPTVTTDSATDITNISATSGGNVVSDGGADVTARGVCWSISPSPTIVDNHTSDGTGTGTFISYITGLTENTLYYVRAYAVNSAGTAYGNEISFTTSLFVCGDQITDIEGNLYNTVEIGTQCWMKENLKTTTYNNNTPIPNVTDPTFWANLTTGAYVWFDNDSTWKNIYGALYNWYTTVDTNNLCPAGWHIPSHAEWTALINYIGGTAPPHGNELKSCRQVNSPLGGDCNTSEHPRWDEDPTYYGTDDYEFSGLPGGLSQRVGDFTYLGINGAWWSSTEYTPEWAYALMLTNYQGDVFNNHRRKKTGRTVRCLRD